MIKSQIHDTSYVGFTNPTTIFPRLGSFYPFSILTKIQTLSKFEANFHKPTGKKDNSKDKKRINRIFSILHFFRHGSDNKPQ